ncbi:VWA domain-containing protein [Desulfosporosinus sp. BICA1-9]|uniref:VWA domain-containing protein n=1 Tax=Desulfosporosinus sp. BICA1-9 TaxID=1531958 RepID=UPI00054B91F1|nr:VWA domain-containing protein [Desulfosporosinus sp. BICA1-9]KJS86179.1 MAG: hypothetical protein JL57_17060 [Desulfosporosinus sp. BICA1-9]
MISAVSRALAVHFTPILWLTLFWQFVGIGRENYGILEKLDTMESRVVDNANFFAIDDIDRISDEQLYERLLNEFPHLLG